MGILNVTPDSFSDGGLAASPEAAAERAEQLVAEGADILDLGAESTRPGAAPVDAATELARLLPAIAAIRRRLPAIPLSIDTYKASVAAACIEAGADVINDVEGGSHEADQAGSPMARTCARLGCPLILMHRRKEADYKEFWPEILTETSHLIQRARWAGLPPEQLWVDPGFGFGKTPAQNLQLQGNLDRPELLGTARVNQGKFRVNYMNTSYQLDGSLLSQPTQVSFQDLALRDLNGNRATFTGGINHQGFSSIFLDINSQLSNFQVLNTSAKDNELFFGTAYATGSLAIKGSTSSQ